MPNLFTRRPLATVLARTAPVLLVAGSLLASCCTGERVAFTRLNSPPRRLSPLPVEDVEVLTVTPPERPHTDLGLMRVTGGMPPHSVHTDVGTDEVTPVSYEDEIQDMIGALRKRAAAIGCDAILITSIDRHEASRATINGIGVVGYVPSMQASCVVYKTADRSRSDGS
jgi:hypothetical protein